MNFGRSPASLQQQFEMSQVVVTKNALLAVSLSDAFDHGVVVESIRQDEAIRQQPRYRRDASFIGNIARGEDKGRFFAMKVGKFAFEFDQGMIGAGNIAGTACADTHACPGFYHCADDLRVLRHRKVIV